MKIFLIAIAIILGIGILTNPNYNDFNDYIGRDSKTYLLRRQHNYILYSIYTVETKSKHVWMEKPDLSGTYLGITKNFFLLNSPDKEFNGN